MTPSNRYSLLLTALSQDAFRAMSHLISDGDEIEDNAYATLKAALISSHVLSNYQRVEMLSRSRANKNFGFGSSKKLQLHRLRLSNTG
jgi:hypothetical protein